MGEQAGASVTPEVLRSISVPAQWFLGAQGDPLPRFDYLHLDLMSDGTVQWHSDKPEVTAPSTDDGDG